MGLISLIIGIISFIVMILALFPFLGWINWFNIAVASLGIILGGISVGSKAPDSPLGKIGIALCGIVCIIGGLRLLLGGGII
ncbi:hypothetical protein M1N80_01915 [Peptococcaceae bacterium]|nr:hypothetical protein [Peptococcaceae bacterium]